MTTAAAGNNRLPSLTGLRFLAAFTVFGLHATATPLIAAGDPAPLTWAFRQGATGVSFFFILSGFVLTWSARPGDLARQFWRRRAAKIYPNHLVTALAALAAVTIGAATTGPAIVANLLLVQAWTPDETIYYGLNTPSWSLSCETTFYLAFPVLLPAIRRIPANWLWPTAGAALATIAAVPAAAQTLPDDLQYWYAYVFPPVRLAEFITGILMARIVQANRWVPLGVLPAAAIVTSAYIGSGYLPGAYSYVAGTALPFAVLIPAVATADLRGTRSPLRNPALVWLGEISFAFYLVHQLVIRVFENVVPHQDQALPATVLIFVAMLAVSVFAAWALYRMVEKPMMRRLAHRPGHGASHRRPATQHPESALEVDATR